MQRRIGLGVKEIEMEDSDFILLLTFGETIFSYGHTQCNKGIGWVSVQNTVHCGQKGWQDVAEPVAYWLDTVLK